MGAPSIDTMLRLQDGVISRRQVLAAGLDDNDIERLVRRRMWAVVHPGVYVEHTGPLRWIQRAWAALLALEPAVLAGTSALRAHGWSHSGARAGQGDDDRVIYVAVDRDRHVKAPTGVVLVRRTGFGWRGQGHLSPPRLRIEEAVIDVAELAARDSEAVAVIADACQQGLTTPGRLLQATRLRSRMRRRRLLAEVLDDAGNGVRSVLERRYAREVERAHGLPTGRRQRRVSTRRGATYRDVEYSEQAVVIELDGRLVHASAEARWGDVERDIESAIEGDLTVRLGWGQVAEPCRTAAGMARLLRSRGWLGHPRPCSPTCPLSSIEPEVGQGGGSPALDAGDPPHRGRPSS